MAAGETGTPSGERADLAETRGTHRRFLRYTVRGLTDEQAAQRTTASELTLGGLIKHVAATESQWAAFIVTGPEAMGGGNAQGPEVAARWAGGFQMQPGDTLAGLGGPRRHHPRAPGRLHDHGLEGSPRPSSSSRHPAWHRLAPAPG
ncbi:MAG TPA: DUF664 domain-containing protein [Streptosporangiaceae bacterium]|nr:DUF664 domain-containing protein [Streptosporangiaceae bacterium]